MPTAILIDGAFFIKRIRKFEPHNYFNAQRIADLTVRCVRLLKTHSPAKMYFFSSLHLLLTSPFNVTTINV